LSSTDPLFHHSLYDWLAERRLTDQLLEVRRRPFQAGAWSKSQWLTCRSSSPLKIRTPFIEQYLSSEPLSHSRAELLWQYYVRNGHYAQAAVVQANLAQSTEYVTFLGRCRSKGSADARHAGSNFLCRRGSST
jgi:nuclear pore complex protein Nup155